MVAGGGAGGAGAGGGGRQQGMTQKEQLAAMLGANAGGGAGTPQRSPQAGRSTQEDNFMDFDLSMGGNKKAKGKKGGQLQRNKGKKSRQWWCLFLCRM